jgi:hypothetical protein
MISLKDRLRGYCASKELSHPGFKSALILRLGEEMRMGREMKMGRGDADGEGNEDWEGR